MADHSRTQVNKAGQVLKRWGRGDLSSEDEVRWAKGVLVDFRASHRVPLTKATMGLRSVVQTEQCELQISQRLKRMPKIIEKLVREPTMKLTTMQDVGGCRAVLESIEDVRRVEDRFTRNRRPLKSDDYIAAPQPSGYRGVHIIVEYDGCPIEVQLRSRVMHEWAIFVERLGSRVGHDLKSSQGPPELLAFLECASRAMAQEEQEAAVHSNIVEELSRLRQEALPFFPGGD